MKRFLLFSILVALMVPGTLVAQDIFINASVNGYLPMGDSGKKRFPLLHLDKDADPAFIVGGFGIGGSLFKSYSDKFTLKAGANFVRYKYWDAPRELRSESNAPLGSFNFHSVTYALALSGIAQYYISERFSIGAGLGLHFTLASRTKARDTEMLTGDWTLANTHYKSIMPVAPVEVSLKYEKMYYAVRYEQALLNRFRGDLARVKSEGFGLIGFEVGRRIR